EPLLFERFFAGNRVAPRHMGIARDGRTLFDIYLTNDLGRIDAALREHGKPATGDSPFDSAAREAEEAAYLAADAGQRAAILAAAGQAGHKPFDVIRLGLRDADPALRARAREALAAAATPAALALVIETLDEEAESTAREALLAVLDKIADDRPETELARRVHRAMLTPSKVVDRAAWRAAVARATPGPPPDPEEDHDARIEELSTAAAREGAGAEAFVALGEAAVKFARARMAAGRDVRFLLADAEQAAEQALARDATDPRGHAPRADVAYLPGERARAAEHARNALPALLASDRVATVHAATVNAALAEGNTQTIYAAEAKRAAGGPMWDGALLADADAAYAVLAEHPAGTAAQAGAPLDLLGFLGLRGCARAALRQALRRHP